MPVTRKRLVRWPHLPRHDMEPQWVDEIIGVEPDPSTTSEEMHEAIADILHEEAEKIRAANSKR